MAMSKGRVRLPRPQEREMCAHAKHFSRWVLDLRDRIDMEDRMRVQQAILQLTLQYYQWYLQVPQAHQVRVGPKGHRCIFHVFMHALNDLMEARARLDPPIYVPPPPPPETQYVKVPVPMVPAFEDQGTLLGLSMGEELEAD